MAVVDHRRRAVAQLDLAGDHDRLALGEAGDDGDEDATRLAQLDEGLARHQPLAVGCLLQHEHGRAIGIGDDGRLRQGDEVFGRTDIETDPGEHAGHQLAVGIGQRRPHFHVAAAALDLGIDRAHLAGEGLAG